MKYQELTSYVSCVHNDSTVNRCREADLTKEETILCLVNDKRALLNRLNELELIAPRKTRIGETTYVWNCPDHLIPVTNITK